MTWRRFALATALLIGCSQPTEPKAPVAAKPAATTPVNATEPTATKPAVDVNAYGLILPEATAGVAQAFDGAPNIICAGTKLWVDGEAAGDAQEVLETGGLRRLDRLFEVLVARRTNWRASQSARSVTVQVLIT